MGWHVASLRKWSARGRRRGGRRRGRVVCRWHRRRQGQHRHGGLRRDLATSSEVDAGAGGDVEGTVGGGFAGTGGDGADGVAGGDAEGVVGVVGVGVKGRVDGVAGSGVGLFAAGVTGGEGGGGGSVGSSDPRGGEGLGVQAEEDIFGCNGYGLSVGARISERRRRILSAMVALGVAKAWESGRKRISSVAAAEDPGRGGGPRGGGGLGVREAAEDSDVSDNPMGGEDLGIRQRESGFFRFAFG
uniref:Uncharacterized protein n=1 Tax=Oryza punctata TaxID=4537 RepID=A0A0E0KF80_ORYPU